MTIHCGLEPTGEENGLLLTPESLFKGGIVGRKIHKGLREILEQKKGPIVEKWRKHIHKSYPPETAQFLQREKNKFSNPIGSSIEESIWPLYDQLIGEADPATTKKLLDNLVRVRAVQDFTPASAVQIIFALKKIIRKEVFGIVQKKGLVNEYLEFESEIDRFGLLAFDVFMECRERVWEIKRNDLLKRPYLLSGGMCPSYMMKRGIKHLEKLKKEITQH